jgi:hypothetical protein
MTHGTATIKQSLQDLEGNNVVEIGENGIITAYLPEMEKFAVLFSNDRWYTFTETEDQFLERFDITKEEI